MLWNLTKSARIHGYNGTMSGLPPTFQLLPPSYAAPDDECMGGYKLRLLERDVFAKINNEIRKHFHKQITTLQDYADAVGSLKPTPKIITQNSMALWDWLDDAEFTRQRLQGLNPEKLERMNRDKWNARFAANGTTPFNVASVQESLEKLVTARGSASFDAAVEAQDIFVCDYSMFDDPDLTLIAASALNRYIAAPFALFHRNPNDSSLKVIAIQLFPGIAEDRPVFLPEDSWDWLLAKIWVQSIDGQHQEIMSHLFECHFIAEIFQVTMNRQLGANHPVYQILHPHFYATLFINAAARHGLLAYDGLVNQVIGVGVPGAAHMIKKAAPTWNFREHSFINSLRNRGFEVGPDVTSPISGYFWYDDGVRLWNTLHLFIKTTLQVFYKTDQDVEDDFELQQWVSDLENPDVGDLKGVSERDGKIFTVEFLTDMITNLIWITTAKHSSGNIAQFELYSFIPNVPAALYSPAPTTKGCVDKEVILKALPCEDAALSQISTVYLLSTTDARPAMIQADYPGLNKNHEAQIHIAEFKLKLSLLSKDIADRNSSLIYPYKSLDPSIVANSIFV